MRIGAQPLDNGSSPMGIIKQKWIGMFLFAASLLHAQNAVPPERWNLYFQATSIGQIHWKFRSPYEGAFSLLNENEHVVSLTSTIFFGLQLARHTQLYFDPELAGGRGFSGVNGLANSSNGELPRVASATPKPYLARLFITHDFALGPETEKVESAPNQLGGDRPAKRYTVVVGRFTVTDYFDNNRYSHDPRMQFMGWSVMYNGAWDYPADVRGYTWGWVNEFRTPNWSVRFGNAGMPRVANGLRFDRRIFINRGDIAEVEHRHSFSSHPGALRLLAYQNHANAGTYREAINLAAGTGEPPDVTATHRNGTRKFGFGLNGEQELTTDVGIFGRLAWNDGKTESFAFTAIDRLAQLGVSVTGSRWNRNQDTVATEFTSAGLSNIHARYLALGGHDFLIGDGALNYGRESIWESYYNAYLCHGFFVALDVQRIWNPAYNRDRGPLWVPSLRIHVELGLKK
jgi:high affinity Mn2+ porin